MENPELTSQQDIAIWDKEFTKWMRMRYWQDSWVGIFVLVFLCTICAAFGLVVLLYGISLALS